MLVDAGADFSELRRAPSGAADTAVAARPLREGARVRRPRWMRRYRAALVALDLLIASAAAAVMFAVRPGLSATSASYLAQALALPVLWLSFLAVANAYSPSHVGNGSEEFRKVMRAGVMLLAAVSVVSYGAKLDIARSLVVFTIPAVTLATLIGRYSARKQLHRARYNGRCVKRVVAVGRDGAVADLVRRMRRDRFAGMDVVAACVTTPTTAAQVAEEGVPVAGSLEDVVQVVQQYGAHAVAVTSASETAAVYLRQLSWQLEGSGIELLVSPGLIEVAGPRLHIRPFVGLPLLAIEEPVFAGRRRLLKGALDRCGAAVALVLIAPVMLAIALAVKLDSPGPVLFRQTRVGANGRHYTIFKFRSMVIDADAQLAELLAQNEGAGLLFKMRHDPRVTPVGRWLRRFSLDELPQLLNVLTGSMSLVGPRPPLPHEVEGYDNSIRRRLLVKPGLTGLWQISGRSDLSWGESVRLDLRYVENWSLTLDLLILWKTAAAVFRGRGAY